ncbi:hypothetical protein GCM10023203_27580 [Actinomycetospora straminea]|uniref:TadE-like protein n=1 Tax=Actinomycetospora straminea TaxID=663607 RepID=A0ABP9EET1_9PSEU
MVLAVVLAAMGAVVLQLRCVDAATEAARFGARGDLDGARRAAARLLPDGSEVTVDVAGDDVVARVRAAPLGSALPGVRVGAEALAGREPSPVAPAEGPDPLAGGPTDGAPAGTASEVGDGPPGPGPVGGATAGTTAAPTAPPVTEPLPTPGTTPDGTAVEGAPGGPR